MKSSTIEELLMLLLYSILLCGWTYAQDTPIAQCYEDLEGCEPINGTTGSVQDCRVVLECLTGLRSRCDLSSLSLRIKWYEYKCSDQGQADEAEYYSCLLTALGGPFGCFENYTQAVFSDNPGTACLAIGKYEDCVSTNCGVQATRYIRAQLGDSATLICSESNGVVDLGLPSRFCLIWFSILVYMLKALY